MLFQAYLWTDSNIYCPALFLQLDPVSWTVTFSSFEDNFQNVNIQFDAGPQPLTYGILVGYHWLTGDGVQRYSQQGLIGKLFQSKDNQVLLYIYPVLKR